MPKIFAKETTIAAKAYINNKQFTPILRSYSPILDGIESIPDLYGYIRTTKNHLQGLSFQVMKMNQFWQPGIMD